MRKERQCHRDASVGEVRIRMFDNIGADFVCCELQVVYQFLPLIDISRALDYLGDAGAHHAQMFIGRGNIDSNHLGGLSIHAAVPLITTNVLSSSRASLAANQSTALKSASAISRAGLWARASTRARSCSLPKRSSLWLH